MSNFEDHQLKVKKLVTGWNITGEGIDAIVFGSPKYGPNGEVVGVGSKNHRRAILAAVERERINSALQQIQGDEE